MRPTHVTAGSDCYFHMWCPSVRPHFSKFRKTKKLPNEYSDHYWRDRGSCRVDHW